MLTHRGFSAWIIVDGKPLPEYLVAIDTTLHQVSCWIPSEEGKNFTVAWKDHGGRVDTCSFITLDGFVVPGRFLFGEGVAMRQGIRISKSTERPFIFQKVNESEAITTDVGSKEIGMITLRIKRVARVATRPANSIQELPQPLLGKRKAGDLRVGFGHETKAYEQYPSTWTVKSYDHDSTAKQPSTYVSFVFRYRSREFLELQGISTDDGTPPPTSKRIPVRRVVSLPLSISTPAFINPPKKKARLTPGAPSSIPTPEMRRTVSCKVLSTKQRGFPGQGMILFGDISEQTGITTDSRGGNTDSTEAGGSQSSGTD